MPVHVPERTMPAELCRAETSDGLFLDGALLRPDSPRTQPRRPPVDVFLLVHGTGSNFYAPGVLEHFAHHALDDGFPVLRVNTRGHDGMASIPGRGRSRPGGAAYENIAEARLDLACWIDFLGERGFERVAVVGHSMGAVKTIDAQARAPHARVAAIVALSPPRFSHAQLMAHPRAQPFRDDFRRASELEASGDGDALISVRQPLPMVLTAAGFLAKYGPHDDYDFVPRLPELRVPACLIMGSEAAARSPAFEGLPAELERQARAHPLLEVHVVPGADVNFAACLDKPYRIASDWLGRLPS